MDKLVKYFKRRWLLQTTPEELSIYEAKATTNNGTESYHAKLKSIIKISHPRIWNFMTTLNDIIADTDNENGRLRLGKRYIKAKEEEECHIRRNAGNLQGKTTEWSQAFI